MRKLSMVLVLPMFLLVPAAVSAQAQGEVAATAHVLAQLSVDGQADLQFGEVIPGFPTTVLPGATEAGRFLVEGGGNSEVSLNFSLPGALSHVDDAGTTMAISFPGDLAGIGSTSSAVSELFDPGAQQIYNLTNGSLYVFIGGMVSPLAAQPAGDYEGTITLNVAYTGS